MTQSVRLIVVAQEFPYPPTHGGRADVWRRLVALKDCGASLALVCWFEEGISTPTEIELATVRGVVDSLVVIPKKPGLRRAVLRLWQIAMGTPSHAAARMLSKGDFVATLRQLAPFKANAVLLDSPYGGVFASRLSKFIGVPLFYRSHNIEHKYFNGQAAAANVFHDRLAWRLACVHLYRFEKRMQQQARIRFDISASDLLYWQSQGLTGGYWLPPLPEAALNKLQDPSEVVDFAHELAFLGNLHAPNNVRGLLWFVEHVMPHVWMVKPETKFTIAGAHPGESIRQLVRFHPRLQLLENITDAPRFLAHSKVLVNPVLTGSGVNVKTLDMLMTQRPIVSTQQGVAGLPLDIQALCYVASSPEQFASKLLQALDNPAIDTELRKKSRLQFSITAISQMLDLMRDEIYRD